MPAGYGFPEPPALVPPAHVAGGMREFPGEDMDPAASVTPGSVASAGSTRPRSRATRTLGWR